MRTGRSIWAMLIVGLVLAAQPAGALFSVLGIKNSMVEFLLEQLSTEGEFVISAEEVIEPEDGVTAIRGLTVADAQGVWLTADRLDFNWNPSRLLRGEVEFSNLSVVGIDVIRAPVIPEGQEQEALDAATPEVDQGMFEWPRSPLTLRIDRMALEQVMIRKAVLGHAISFNAQGAAQDEGDVQSARLQLSRIDQVTGTISFEYARNFSDNTLAINLDAAEAAGGLVANLADLPRDAASKVTLSADGPPTDWRMQFELALADLVTAGGKAEISYEGPVWVNADFSAKPGPKMAPNFAALMGAEARLIAKVNEAADGVVEITEGRLTSPHARLGTSGTYSRVTGAADLKVSLSADRGLTDPFDAVDLAGLTFEGNVKGGPGTLTADGQLTVDTLRTDPIDIASADMTVAVRQSGPSDTVTTELDLNGITKGLRLDKIAADIIGTADTQVVASLTGDELLLETAWLDSEILQISASGAANLDTLDADIGFGLTSPAATKVAAAYGVDIQGSVNIAGEAKRVDGVTDLDVTTSLKDFSHAIADAKDLKLVGQVRTDGETTSFALNGSGQALRIDRIGPDLLPTADLTINGKLTDQVLELAQLRLESPLAQTVVNGTYGLETRKGRIGYRLTTENLGPVARLYDVNASGQVAARGQADLDGVQPPRLNGTFSGQGLALDGTRWGDVKIDHDVLVSPDPSGTIQGTFWNGRYGKGAVKTTFALTQPRLTLTDMSADVLGLTARGGVEVNLDSTLASGTLNVTSRDLARLRGLIGTRVDGGAKGKLTLSTPSGRQRVDLDLTATGLSAEGARAKSASIKARVDDATGTPRVDGRLDAKGVSVSGIDLSRADVIAKGPLSALDITANLAGIQGDIPVTADAKARVNAAGSTIRADIARLTASLGEDQVRLNRPAIVRVTGSTIAAQGLDISLPGGGEVIGSVTSHGGPLSGDLSLNIPDLAILQRLADAPVSKGALRAKAVFDTRRSRGDVELSAKNLVLEGVDGTGLLGLDAGIAWRGRAANIDATLAGDFGDPLILTGTVPIRRGPIPALASRGPVTGKVTWNGQIGDLWALVPAPGHVLSGRAVVDLGVTGDISDPTITGGIEVKDGGYQNLDLGTILTDLKIDTGLSQGDLAVTVSATDGADGAVSAKGSFALDGSGLDVTTDIDKAVLVRRDDITARIGGGVTVAGPLTALDVKGTVVVQEAEVRLLNSSAPSIVTLGDVLIKGAPEPEEDDGGSGVTLNVDVNSPGRMFVRGRGLDSEWKMGLQIRGDAAEPRITGRIERVRGTLDLIGKQFKLDRGRIDFDGAEEIDPRIDIVLERETSKLTGRIVVNGPASDPRLNFTSSPALPEDEVLPRVIFGKSSQALTGSQAIQLGLGLATLMDGGAGTLDAARAAVGVDQLRIEADEDGNASVAVGKEVAEGIWVGTKQPLGEGGTSVAVEIDIFEDITIDTEVEAGGESSIGIEWKKDF